MSDSARGRRIEGRRSGPRAAFVAAALGTIVAGLLVHRGIVPLAAAPRDVLGDALWAMMIAWWLGALLPTRAAWERAVGALAICWLVEGSQLLHTPSLDAVRRTTLGRLVLGSGFDARDLGAYAVGVAAALGVEHVARRRRSAHPS